MKLDSLLLIGALLLGVWIQPLSADVLELRDKQIVNSSEITLGDFLSSSEGVSEDELTTVVGPAPALGHAKEWTRDEILAVIPASIKSRGMTWTGSATCRIERPAQTYGEPEIRQLITDQLNRDLPSGSQFKLLQLVDADKFLVPSGELTCKVTLSPGTMRNPWGQASLEFYAQGQLSVVKNVRFQWSCEETVWQVLNRVESSDVLSQDSFQQVQLDVLCLPGNLKPTIDFPTGKLAAHILTPGRVLMENDWKEPTLVARDDMVTVNYEHNGLSISLRARALAGGVMNQVIPVQNVESRKIFNARIVDERTLVYEN